jgi:MFS family permease
MTHEGPAEGGAVAVRTAVVIFGCFAFGYFFSALLRAVTATLAPVFSAELGLGAADLGLLAGAYFFGFAALQLPLGSALDRYGPKRVLLAFMAVAVLSCVAFALARSFTAMIVARALIGLGVAACLMAPLTSFRHRFSPAMQMRANSWMLMTGSLGMLASTLPVQWLLPSLGWRGLFGAAAGCLLLSMLVILIGVPADRRRGPRCGSVNEGAAHGPSSTVGYGAIVRHRTFVRLAPMGFFHYGGLIAVQSLWAGPWLTDVARQTPQQAAQGLFVINLAMLLTFLSWGLVMPRLMARAWTAQRLITCGVPFSLATLAVVVLAGPATGAGLWALWCVSCTFVSLSQPAVGQAFGPSEAGRALSAYNLVIFSGVFCVQWGVGLAIDLLASMGMARVHAYQVAFGLFAVCCALSYLWFLRCDDAPPDRAH